MDHLEEIMHDLNYVMEAGSEYGYRRKGGQIEVEQYDDAGTKATVIGYLSFRKVGN